MPKTLDDESYVYDVPTPAERRERRITEIQAEGRLRRTSCPRCGARPGEPCHSPSWYRYDHGHKERRQAAGL